MLLAEKMEGRKQQELMSIIGRCLKLEMPEMDFPLIPWGLDIKKAEHERTDAFEL